MTGTTNINIILVEDHHLVRQGIRTLLETQPGYSVMKEYTTASEFLADNLSGQADVILIDIKLPDISGIEVIKRLRAQNVSAKLLALTAKKDSTTLRHCLQKGADGFVVKESTADELFRGIESTLAGDKFVSECFVSDVQESMGIKNTHPPIAVFKLTTREIDVLNLLLQEFKNKEIATKLCISTKAVEKHKKNIFTKCKVKNSTEVLKLFGKK